MTPSDFSDELFESMTSTGGQTPASRELRDAVLSQTTRTIRNRRRMRRAGLAAHSWRAIWAELQRSRCGRTIVRWTDSQLDPPSDRPRMANVSPNGNVRRLVRPEDDQIADGSVTPAAARLTPYERLCRTGDQQLEKHDDIQAAIRSYKKALQLASADQRSIAPDRDTWLLMALKQSIN